LKKGHFCMFKIAMQGVSFWHFHVYRLYHELAHPLYFSPFFLSTFIVI
jgi:hypothetical protein